MWTFGEVCIVEGFMAPCASRVGYTGEAEFENHVRECVHEALCEVVVCGLR